MRFKALQTFKFMDSQDRLSVYAEGLSYTATTIELVENVRQWADEKKVRIIQAPGAKMSGAGIVV